MSGTAGTKLVVANVGNSPQQLALGVALLEPDEIILIHSDQSKASIGRAKKYLERAGFETSRFKRAKRICIDANDPQDIYTGVAAVLDARISNGWSDVEVHFLASGGTAAMTGAVIPLLPPSAVLWFSMREQLIPLRVDGGDQPSTIPVPLGQPISYEQVTSINPKLDFNDQFVPAASWLLDGAITSPRWFEDRTLIDELALLHAAASSTNSNVRSLWEGASKQTWVDQIDGLTSNRLEPQANGAGSPGVEARRRTLVGLLHELMIAALIAERVRRSFPSLSNPVALDWSVEWRYSSGELKAEIDIVLRRGPFLAFVSIGSGNTGEMVKKVSEIKDRAAVAGGKEARSLAVIHEPNKLGKSAGYRGFVNDVRAKSLSAGQTTVLGLADLLGWSPTDLNSATESDCRSLADATSAAIFGEFDGDAIGELDSWLAEALPDPESRTESLSSAAAPTHSGEPGDAATV